MLVRREEVAENQQEPLQEWFTAKELAALPGLPLSADYILKLGKMRAWKVRERARAGNVGRIGREFHISSLPIVTQVHLGLPDPAGVIVRFGSFAANDNPMDGPAYRIVLNLAATMQNEIPREAISQTGIVIVMAALQKVYGIEALRRVVPCVEEVVWE